MKTAVAAIATFVTLCAGLFVSLAAWRWWTNDKRHSDQITVGIAILILMASTMIAAARPSPYPTATPFNGDRYGSAQIGPEVVRSIRCPPPACVRKRAKRPPVSHRTAGRPAAWCGWWLGHHLGVPYRHLWVARNWAKIGSDAGGPGPGIIVVWRHHVGIITGRKGNQWVVKSGNDGGRVRERARSVAGAIAFRTPHGNS